MNKNLLALILIGSISAFNFVNAQVGIKSSTDNSVTNFPHPSAALDVQSSNKGLLLPRVPLTSKTASTPVVTPSPGMLLYNNATTLPKGIYTWDTNPLTNALEYNRVVNFFETPKLVTIFFNNDLTVLTGKNPGNKDYYLGQDPIILSNNSGNPGSWNTIIGLDQGYYTTPKLSSMYLESALKVDIGQHNGIVIPAGTYTFEISYNIIASTPTTRSSSLNSSSYYDFGYFNDIQYANYITGSTSTNKGTLQTTYRSEVHTVGQLNKPHIVKYFYMIQFTTETFVTFQIGRATASTYNDGVTLKKDGSFIKILKIS